MQQLLDRALRAISSVYPYINYWYIACGCILAFAIICNLSINKYRLTNKQSILLTAKLNKAMAQGTDINISALAMPTVYLHQWQLLKHTSGVYPSQLITFRQINSPVRFIYLSLAAIAVTGAITLTQATSTLVNLTVPLLLIGAVALADGILKAINSLKVAKARKIHFKLASTMDNYFGDNYFLTPSLQKQDNMCLDKDVNAVLNRIEEIKLAGITDSSAQEISMLLNSENLKKTRTGEQQKKINLALNGVLHQISNKKANNTASIAN